MMNKIGLISKTFINIKPHKILRINLNNFSDIFKEKESAHEQVFINKEESNYLTFINLFSYRKNP